MDGDDELYLCDCKHSGSSHWWRSDTASQLALVLLYQPLVAETKNGIHALSPTASPGSGDQV
jgi:hypothetical protein